MFFGVMNPHRISATVDTFSRLREEFRHHHCFGVYCRRGDPFDSPPLLASASFSSRSGQPPPVKKGSLNSSVHEGRQTKLQRLAAEETNVLLRKEFVGASRGLSGRGQPAHGHTSIKRGRKQGCK